MSLTIPKRPIITDGPDVYRWNAVDNPLIYEFQREDVTFTGIIDSFVTVGLVALQGISSTSEMNVGDSIWVDSISSVYDDQQTTISSIDVISGGGGGGVATVNIPFQGVEAGSSGYINLLEARENYRLDMFFYNPVNDKKYFTEGLEFSPQQNGFLRADFSALMRSFLEAEIITGVPQPNLALKFYIEVIERYGGISGDIILDDDNEVGVILAENQLLESSNLQDYTPIVESDGAGFTVSNLGKFLTRFDEPSLWTGWGTTVTGLSNGDNTLFGATRFVKQTPLNVNKEELQFPVSNPTNASKDEVNKMTLTNARLNENEEYRRVVITTAISLLKVLEVINASGATGLPATSLRSAGDIMLANTSYTRVPVGVDSLLRIASFLDELP